MGGDSSGEQETSAPQAQGSPSAAADFKLDPATMLKIGNIMSQFHQEDDRCSFLNSLKPLISEPRRKRVDEAARLLKLFAVLPNLKDIGLF